MKMILDYIFKGEKKKAAGGEHIKKPKGIFKEKENKENASDKIENNEEGISNYQQKEKIRIKRPIIFICNDIYAKGLRELRKKAIVFHFRKTPTERLINRLRDICHKEHVLIDHEIMVRLCESNDNDIRSCLNTLELISRNKKEGIRTNNIVLKENNLLNNKKENTKTCMDIMEELIYKNQRNEKNIKFLKNF